MKEKWESVRLGEYFKIKHGWAFKGEFFTQEGKYVLLTPGNFNPDGGIKLKGDKEKYYSGPFPKEFLLKDGDFLVVMTDLTQDAPILGSPAFVKENDRFLHNQRLGKITDLNDTEMNPVFLYYLFNSFHVRNQIKATATGATVKHTAPDRIYNVEVNLPPLLTQRKIAAVLSTYDDLIENNNRRIEILEDIAATIYREWFVEFRFPGHENVPMVESELGLIPQGWEVKQLGEICHVIMGLSPKSDFYNETGEGLPFHQGVTDFGERFPTNRVYCTIQKRIAETDDILFSVRAPVGRINIANKKLVIGRGLSAIRNKHGNQAFLLQQLKDRFQEEDTMGSGAIFNAIRKTDLLGIPLLDPTESIIGKFEEIANPVFVKLANLTLKNINLRQTRDLLLPKLISGEIDVSELDIDTNSIQPKKGGKHIPDPLKDRLHSDEKILGGKPIIKGTRLAAAFILELLERGWSEEEVLENYPSIGREDIAACLAYQQKATDASVSG